MRKKSKIQLFAISFILLLSSAKAQVSESCNCTIDTLGYSSFIQTLTPNEEADFQFHVSGTFAVAYGVIGSSTPQVVQSLIDDSPNVTTIVMYACPGSQDDESNLEASRMIHEQGYKMYLPFDGWIASGATDMFIAGSVRVLEVTNDAVGVHSWSDGNNDATDYPVGHQYHLPYINYYVEMGFTQQQSEDFYYFTINAASASNIYWMTDSEIDQYRIRSCRFSESPNYTVSEEGGTLIADVENAQYQWLDCSNNNEEINGETSRIFQPTINGSYAVIIEENGCGDTSDCVSFTTLSTGETEFIKPSILFPNPTKEGIFGIPDTEQENVFVYNTKGQLLALEISNNYLSFEGLPKGIYLVKIQKKESTVTTKIILE